MVYMQREWEPQEGKIPCLSIQQPYASGIMWGKKTIELRTWRTSYKGIIAIHAGLTWVGGAKLGKRVDDGEVAIMREAVHSLGIIGTRMGDYPTGAIIGIARLVKCAAFTKESWEALRDQHKSNALWDPRVIGWQFADIRPLPEPICNVRGHLGLFPVDVEPLQPYL